MATVNNPEIAVSSTPSSGASFAASAASAEVTFPPPSHGSRAPRSQANASLLSCRTLPDFASRTQGSLRDAGPFERAAYSLHPSAHAPVCTPLSIAVPPPSMPLPPIPGGRRGGTQPLLAIAPIMPRPLPPQPWFPGVLPFSANLPVYLGPQPFYSSIYGGNRRVLLPTPQPSTVKPLTITRRFDLRFIRFGSFQFFSGVNDTSAVSVLCAHQLLVYEMQWACGFATGAHGGCRLTKLFVFIEIPLANIHSACVEGEYLVLTMKPVAQVRLSFASPIKQWGNEPCWGAPLIAQDGFNEDLTGGQLSAAFHYVQLKKSGACALLDALCTFNDRIRNTLRTVTRWGEPCAPEPRNVVGASATTADGCRCGSFYSCSTRDCDCVAQSAVCSLQCVCMSTLFNCQNPLNIMGGERRICVEQLRADHCLMHMVGKIQGVASYLDAQVLVPCCKVLARVRSLIPSKRPCPAQIPCHRMFEYSWCTGKVHDATLNPRNHCRMCNNCAERDAQHCPICNKCTVRSVYLAMCPNCTVRRRHSMH